MAPSPRRRAAAAIVALGVAGIPLPPATAQEAGPITLSAMGSFHVGGRLVELSGKPVREVTFTPGGTPARVDPNGRYMVGQMYAQYHIPAPRRGRLPILFWHGGGLSGVTWETTPDGREGWSTYFLRRGWATYVSDAVERGRAGFSAPDVFPGEPLFLTIDNPFERFRIGAGPGSWNEDPAKRRLLPGSTFPADTESYLNFVRQVVPRWTTTDQMTIDAYTALVDRVGDSVVLVHSQAGQFGLKVAQARPDKVKALILIEPAGIGDPALVDRLKGMPILAVYGDYIAQDSRWPAIKSNGLAFLERARAAGADVEVIDLPAIGIRGNSHMLMMDRNSDQGAAVVQDWLVRKGLWN